MSRTQSDSALISTDLTALYCQTFNKILMFNGRIKSINDLSIGDVIMGNDSTPKIVINKIKLYDLHTYEVKFKNGEIVILNETNLVCLKKNENCQDVSIENIKDDIFSKYSLPICFRYRHIELDPYIIGIWLGVGNLDKLKLSNKDSDVVMYLYNVLPLYNFTLESVDNIYYIRHIEDGFTFINFLEKNNLHVHKHIPHHYKANVIEIQLQILSGLVDAVGKLKDDSYLINIESEELSSDILFLARSLNINAVCKHRTNQNKTISLNGQGIHHLSLLCKALPCTYSHQDNLVEAIHYLGKTDHWSIELDKGNTYVNDSFCLIKTIST